MRCAAKNVDNRVRGITPVMITGSEQARLRLASLGQAEFIDRLMIRSKP